MGVIETWRQIRSHIDESGVYDRVIAPLLPPGRKANTNEEHEAPPSGLRDALSGWSMYICYQDASGSSSERRITCRRLERGLGGSLLVGAFCHEREAYRAFRLDRIREAFDIHTGEALDHHAHFESLKMQGLPVSDRGMATFAKMLVFMTLCDGDGHDAEWVAIENALGRYALRFDGDDRDIESAMAACRRLSPDGRDFTNCLAAVLRAPTAVRKQVARLAIESCASVVDADGRHADEELHWGIEIGAALKKLAV